MKAPEHFSNVLLREIVDEYVQGEKDRRIMIRKYADRRTLEQIAEEEQLSVSQVKRIIKKHYYTVFGLIDKK